jgi:PAS domain S-box-containing protein
MESNNSENLFQAEYEQFLKGFGLVITQASLYSVHHRIAKDAISRFFSNLDNLLKQNKTLEINISDDFGTAIINNSTVETSNPLVKNLFAYLGQRHFLQAKFSEGITLEDITKFFEVLCQEQAKLEKTGGLEKTLQTENVKGIAFEKVVYKRIHQGEKVVGGKEVEALPEINILEEAIRTLSSGDEEKRKQIMETFHSHPDKLAEAAASVILGSKAGQEDKDFSDALIQTINKIGDLALKELNASSSVRTKKGILKAFETFEKEIVKSFSKTGMAPLTEEKENIIRAALQEYKDVLELDIMSEDFGKKKKELEKMEKRLHSILDNPQARQKLSVILENNELYESFLAYKSKGPSEKPARPLPIDAAAVLQNIRNSLTQEMKNLPVSKKLQPEEINSLLNKMNEVFTGNFESAVKAFEKTHQELYESAENLNIEKDKLSNIVKSVSEGVIVIDPEGKMVYMNESAEKLLHSKAKDKIGKSIYQETGEEYLLSLSKTVVHKGTGKAMEILEVTADEDTKKTIQSGSAILQDKDGKPLGMVSVLKDIQKQKELQKLQADFIDNVTHELRTPLVAMSHSIKLLLEGLAGPIGDEQKKFLEIALRNIKRLQDLIDQLLDFSKITSDKATLDYADHRIEELVDDSVSSIQAWADTKQIIIEKNISTDVPEVPLDYDKVIQVMTNLLSNALKFTPEKGRIRIESCAVSEPSGGTRCLKVSVSDTGKGIAKEDLERIFEKFVQVGARTPMEIRGTGLGLPITRKIIELHRGKIWVESEPGKGSTFSFTLPFNTGEECKKTV